MSTQSTPDRDPCPEELAKFIAEASKANAEARLAEAQARAGLAQAKCSELLLEREVEKRVKEKAQNEHHKVYVFDSEVSSAPVKKCIDQLTTWSRQDPGCNIEIQLNSPGGSIFDGFALIDFIRGLRDQGHQVTTVGYGMVASMAAVILQAGDERVLGSNAFMLLHEGGLGVVGDFGAVEDRVKLMEQMHERILTLFEDRARPLNAKTTKRYIRGRWQRRDWWLASEEAARLGLIDTVR